MPSVLLLHASTHGHTGTIAARIADDLRSVGHEVVLDDRPQRTDPQPGDYDGVIVGASIHAGAHQDEIATWARHHAVTLNLVPSAFFSVCLTAAEDDDEARAAVRDYLDDFEDRTGWLPRIRTTFAGALQYREYGLPTRIAMRVLMHRGDHPTDTSRDHDFTDWTAVHEFARRCGALAAAHTPR